MFEGQTLSSTHPPQSNGRGGQPHQASLAAVGAGGEREVVLQGRDGLLNATVLVHLHMLLNHPGGREGYGFNFRGRGRDMALISGVGGGIWLSGVEGGIWL